MSRETDSSSSGPQGRGKAAYPSGTPPYGTRQYPSQDGSQDGAGANGAAEAAEPDEPRTETTLTTRIRINIPGSRPIPPVVMRKPMSGSDGPAPESDGPGTPQAAPAERRPGAPAAPAAQAPAAPAAPAPEKPAGDWFAPRKAPAAAPEPEAPAGPQGAGFPPPGPGGQVLDDAAAGGVDGALGAE
ncbi:hypothetical protein ABZ859_32490, partial [Streptomyces sp. NPDC047097]